jgi:hypothetical protein
VKPLVYSKTFWVALISGLLDLIVAFQGYPDAVAWLAPAQMVLVVGLRIVTTQGVYLGITEP